MKVRLTEMRYFDKRRIYPGETIEWPFPKLGRGMVALEAPAPGPVEKPEPKRGRPNKEEVL